ncbi:rhomboid family intramembrane serine protease [Candidatus Pacearchaeota archaeon]|nr:rhomboid family intramembrane serine protease [Candidatus Pacearchaeota archaeon]
MERELRNYTKKNLRRGIFSLLFNNLSITAWLILINVLFFVVFYILYLINPLYMDYVALKPSLIIQGKYLWTFLTSMFMHAGPLHLFVNMFVLFSLGSFCEKIIGKKRYLWFYLISGLVASAFFVIFAVFFGNTLLGSKIFGSVDISAVGASGAIFAIAGLFVILTPKLKFSIIFLPFFSLPAYIMIPLVLFATWLVSAGTGFPIGNTAHFGGFLSGIVYGVYLRNKYKKKVVMLNRMIH